MAQNLTPRTTKSLKPWTAQDLTPGTNFILFPISGVAAAAGAYRRCRRAEPPKAEAPAAAAAAKIAKKKQASFVTRPSSASVRNKITRVDGKMDR